MYEHLLPTVPGKRSIRRLAAALVIAVGWSGAASAGHSSRPHPFNSASVALAPEGGGRGAPPKILVGHDGNRYTDIVGEFSARFRVRADVKGGWRIHGFVLTTGDPDMTDDLPVEQIGGATGVYEGNLDTHLTFTMDAAQAVQQAVDGIDPDRVQRVIDRCNDALPNGPAASDRPGGEIQMHIHAGFSAGRWRGSQVGAGWGWWPTEHVEGRPAIANVTFPASIVCLSRNDPRSAELLPDPVSVDLLVDAKGEVCPKETEVTAFIYYDRPAVAKFRFRRDGELSGLYTRETVEVGGGPPIKGASRVTHLVKETRTYHLDPGQHRLRVEVRGGKKSEVKTVQIECPPFKVTSAWLKYDVEGRPTCPKAVREQATFRSTRPGKAPFQIKTQGGLVVHSGTAAFVRKGKSYVAEVARPNLVMNAFDQDMMALITDDPAANSGWTRLKVECLEVLSGTLDLREFAATRCEGEAALSIRTNMPGEVPYQLDCTGGRSWSGAAQAQQTAPDTFIGVDVVRFDVSNNEQVNCALKTRDPFPTKVLALQGNKYQCHKPSGASGTSDFAPPSRPGDPLPPRQALKGDFSFVDAGSPRCPRQGRAIINFVTDQKANVHYSLDCTHGSFSGVAQPQPGPKGGFVAPAAVSFTIKQTLQANCALKTVAPGKPEVHMLKGHLFQCITPTGVPGASDLAPPTRPDPQKPSGPGRIVVDPPRTPGPSTPPRIVCTGGRVSDGRCVCPQGLNPIAAGANAFRCVKVVTLPPIKTPGPKSSAPQKGQPSTLMLLPSAIKSAPANKPSSVR